MDGLHSSAVASAALSEPPDVPAGSLQFNAVTKVFPDGTQALANSTFSIEPGEFVSLVGPSGCGKSTILRLASGLLGPTAGAITAPSNIGYVFQDATLLPWRTVLSNVELFGELRGIPAKERRRLAVEVIGRVGLNGFERHFPRQLSGGMRMRVSLARSLILRPGVFLFDEPFGSLDEISRERLNDELLEIFTVERFAALFVTHSIAEAVFLSTRVMVMSSRPGRVVDEFEVSFPFPRSSALRYEPRFAAVAGEVSRALRGADG